MTRFSWASLLVVLGLAAAAAGGCDSRQSPPPETPTKPAPTPGVQPPANSPNAPTNPRETETIASRFPAKPIGTEITKSRFEYPAERLRALFGVAMMQMPQGADVKFLGTQWQGKIFWPHDPTDPPCKNAIINDPNNAPNDDEVDFWVQPDKPTSPGDLLVFRTIIGPKSEATWAVSNATPADVVTGIALGEYILAIDKGYAILGGIHPVVRGKRSRAGAPGTWMAVNIEKENGQFVERYYLLNDIAKSVVVYIDGFAPVPIANGTLEYIRVGPTGAPEALKFADANSTDDPTKRLAFRNWARSVAACAKFDGGDPTPPSTPTPPQPAPQAPAKPSPTP